jgi:hypothetical protein
MNDIVHIFSIEKFFTACGNNFLHTGAFQPHRLESHVHGETAATDFFTHGRRRGILLKPNAVI